MGYTMTGETMTLADFLLARITEDEAAAHVEDGWDIPTDCWGPRRVLAECEAKRRIAARISTNPDGFPWHVAVLAEVYADHPDYREEWRP